MINLKPATASVTLIAVGRRLDEILAPAGEWGCVREFIANQFALSSGRKTAEGCRASSRGFSLHESEGCPFCLTHVRTDLQCLWGLEKRGGGDGGSMARTAVAFQRRSSQDPSPSVPCHAPQGYASGTLTYRGGACPSSAR